MVRAGILVRQPSISLGLRAGRGLRCERCMRGQSNGGIGVQCRTDKRSGSLSTALGAAAVDRLPVEDNRCGHGLHFLERRWLVR